MLIPKIDQSKLTSKQPLGLEQFEKFERRTDKIDKIE